MDISVSERSQALMKILVERYIKDGQPVGSKTLSCDNTLSVSPATIRNTMKQLEEMGLIASPHTSSGRIPTELGFRFYVDTILNVQPIKAPLAQSIESELKEQGDTQALVTKASSLLSEITEMAGVVMVPRQESVALRQIEFLPLDGHQVLAILVLDNMEVQNRIILTERKYGKAELDQAAQYLNTHYIGRDIKEMGSLIQQEMVVTQSEMNALMEAIVQMTGNMADKGGQEQLVVQGQSNLIGGDGIASMDKLKQLFDAFGQKQDIAHLLDRCIHGDGVQIYIGHESGYEPLDHCSVVTAPYQLEDKTVGVLGVIGPTRMAYEKVVPVVDMTARLMSAVMK